MTRLKVLVSAYACSPERGSEPAVGWGFVSALRKFHDLWVIVEEEKFRSDIERHLSGNPEAGIGVKFFFLRKTRNRTLRRIWPPSYYWYLRAWHREAFALAARLHAEVGFDLAHQLTMVGFREPGDLWKLGIPFVWGPVGGMGGFPWRFLGVEGLRSAAYYTAYNLINAVHTRFLRRPRKAALAAGTGLIAATPENQAGAMQHWGCASTLLPEVGLPAGSAPSRRARHPGEPLRIVWCGRHVDLKALSLGLRALAGVPGNIPWHLDILGTGPRTRPWTKLASSLGISDRCRFLGWLPRDRVLGTMAEAHLMLITSLRDLTSTVTVEALAAGLPVVCPDHCGFSAAVTDACGIRVPIRTPRQFVAALRDALTSLALDEPRRAALARGALEQAAAFSWDAKAAGIDAIYRRRIRVAVAPAGQGEPGACP
ncbi:MAG: glycosyltransferase family 4 protein [Candidatus Brocadiae bacterium]|nr:glycosyltransferase family 4 protein [Candidatus Brocadiia bacterium]